MSNQGMTLATVYDPNKHIRKHRIFECVVCGSKHRLCTLIPDSRNSKVVSFCSNECLATWSTQSVGMRIKMSRAYEDEEVEDEDMKVYEGQVKDGKIEVDEPEGSKAVLIFDSKPALVYKTKPEAKAVPVKVPVKEAEPEVQGIEKAIRKQMYAEVCGGTRLSSYIRKLHEDGFRGTSVDMFKFMGKKFCEAGWQGAWKTDAKMRESVRGAIYASYKKKGDVVPEPVNPKKGKKDDAVPEPVKPKKVQGSFVKNAPVGMKRRDFWISVLGMPLSHYVGGKMLAEKSAEDIIADLESKLKAKGYEPDHNRLSGWIFMAKCYPGKKAESVVEAKVGSVIEPKDESDTGIVDDTLEQAGSG